MNGKLVGGFIVLASLIAGAAIYYLQVYYWYEEIPETSEAAVMRMISLESGEPIEIIVNGFQGIDAESSPLRFRGCFTTLLNHSVATESYALAAGAEPLTAPGWFECYDAAQLGEDLVDGKALAFLSEPEIADGVDRIIALYDDGRAYVWHQLNDKYKD